MLSQEYPQEAEHLRHWPSGVLELGFWLQNEPPEQQRELPHPFAQPHKDTLDD
jgi:hypothetical protein